MCGESRSESSRCTILKYVASPFGRILLITGNAEYLREQTRARALASVKAADPNVNVVESLASGVSGGELMAMTGPSLFSETTVIVLSELENLPEDAADLLVEFSGQPADDIAMILVHSGGNKGRGVLQKLRKSKFVAEEALNAPKYDNEFAAWVRNHARERGHAMDDRTATALVLALGKDLRALAAAIDQLALAVAEGEAFTSELVGQYFGGRAEVKGFEISDAAFAGNIAGALEKVRWALENKVAPVVVVATFASGLRNMAAVATAGPAMSDSDIAKSHGMPPFKVKSLRNSLRGWTQNGLAQAISVVAQADTDVKGGAAEPGWVIERLVIDIAKARDVK